MHNNILELKVHFELMLILRGLDKINIHTIHNLQFPIAIGPHVCGSSNITKQKEIEKIMQCPFTKSPLLWYGTGLFPKKK